MQQLAVNRILDGSTGERCGIKPKQNPHLLRGCVRTHGRVNFSEDTIKAEKNNKPCHLWNIGGYSIKDGHIQHAGDGLVCLQATVILTEQLSGCAAIKSVTKTRMK